MLKFYSNLRPAFVLMLLGIAFSADAQRFQSTIDSYLQKGKTQWQLTDSDISQYAISDQYDNAQTGITYTYLHQQINGIRIFDAVSTMVIKNGQVAHFANKFQSNAAKRANALQPTISPESAIAQAAEDVGLSVEETPQQLGKDANRLRFTFTDAGIAKENIRVELVFVSLGNSLKLAWNVNFSPKKSADWWNIRIDALTGQVLDKNNWTTYCDFGTPHHHNVSGETCMHEQAITAPAAATGGSGTGRYRAYPLPVESPDFGARQLLVEPHLPDASPFGWHDTDGFDGADYTITRGNNVYVYEDLNDLDSAGYSPDGGSELNFDFPEDLSLPPVENLDANLTNLFYMNNMLHDILYVHGFDEAAGNFQEANYTGQGLGNDYVRAEGFDGGGTDNANFSTPEDGKNGRMQMYLWLSERTVTTTTMEILEPDTMVGFYAAVQASFGPGFAMSVTGQAIMVIDEESPAGNACDSILNASELVGKIAIVEAGGCSFIAKARAVEEAGAIAMVVISSNDAPPIVMGGSGPMSIPAAMISKADGERISAALVAEDTIVMTVASVTQHQDRDCSLDNGIVAHEFAHGLSNRLTGGPDNSSCLRHAEQGGEGWSDWLALILTIEEGDQGSDSREIASYSSNNDDGRGIRRFPYSTDMAINPQTYGDLINSFGPHARGEILCATLWDVTWALIDTEGFDPDWFGGSGGNNIAMRLIVEGMKMQGCNPSYVDVRDAIIKADQLMYDSAYRCIIWEAFARRGLGAYAKDGSAFVAGDETEDFSMSNLCFTATEQPTANFEGTTDINCYGNFSFKDFSTDIPQYYYWDFGDGNSSREREPMHTYSTEGNYMVTLVVSNNIGSDTFSREVTFGYPDPPVVEGNVMVCEGSSTTLTADVLQGHTAFWTSEGNVVFEGNSFVTPPLSGSATYSVYQASDAPIHRVGPAGNGIGGGGIHNTGFEGKLFFTAYRPLQILSVLVYAQGAADRTFTLYDEDDNVIDEVTVFVENGSSRVTLNLEVPAVGNYSLANVSQNLYRNDQGGAYPYVVDNLISIYRSNATDQELRYYYYFYDWQVQEIPCKSDPIDVPVIVEPGPIAGFLTEIVDLDVNFIDISSDGATSWAWDFGDGSPQLFEQNPSYTYLSEGTYEVELTVSNGSCTSVYREIIEVGFTSSTTTTEAAPGLKIYPNPAVDEVTIELDQAFTGKLQLNVTNATGGLALARSLDSNTSKFVINTTALSSGTYQFQIISEQGVSIRRVVIVK